MMGVVHVLLHLVLAIAITFLKFIFFSTLCILSMSLIFQENRRNGKV